MTAAEGFLVFGAAFAWAGLPLLAAEKFTRTGIILWYSAPSWGIPLAKYLLGS
jgi:hypothetical protein